MSTIEAFPCRTDGRNLVSLLMLPCFGGAQRLLALSVLLCNANGDGRRHRKPINQQQRKLLSCPVVCLARSMGGGESVVSRCQLAHDLFNYLALRHRMNPADLWIRPFPIYQKTIKVSLYVSKAPQDALYGPLSVSGLV